MEFNSWRTCERFKIESVFNGKSCVKLLCAFEASFFKIFFRWFLFLSFSFSFLFFFFFSPIFSFETYFFFFLQKKGFLSYLGTPIQQIPQRVQTGDIVLFDTNHMVNFFSQLKKQNKTKQNKTKQKIPSPNMTTTQNLTLSFFSSQN